MNEQELRQQFEEYKKWRSGFEFSGNENLLIHLFCLRELEKVRALNMYCYKGNVEIVEQKIRETIAPHSNSPTASQSEDLIAGKEQSADCPNLSADKLSLPADIREMKGG